MNSEIKNEVRTNWQKLDSNKRKLVWFFLLLPFVLVLATHPLNFTRLRIAARTMVKPANSTATAMPVVAQSPAVPVPVPVASTQVAAAMATASGDHVTSPDSAGAFLGHWVGHGIIKSQSGLCNLDLEIKLDGDSLVGFPQMSCLISPLYSGEPVDAKNTRPIDMLAPTNPTSALLRGKPVNGSVDFHVEKILNTNEKGCNMESFAATIFGSKELSVQFGDVCGGGNMLLLKQPR